MFRYGSAVLMFEWRYVQKDIQIYSHNQDCDRVWEAFNCMNIHPVRDQTISWSMFKAWTYGVPHCEVHFDPIWYCSGSLKAGLWFQNFIYYVFGKNALSLFLRVLFLTKRNKRKHCLSSWVIPSIFYVFYFSCRQQHVRIHQSSKCQK